MPVLGNVDEVVIKSSAYLMEAAREFRLKLKTACLPPKAKKGQAPPKVMSLPSYLMHELLHYWTWMKILKLPNGGPSFKLAKQPLD